MVRPQLSIKDLVYITALAALVVRGWSHEIDVVRLNHWTDDDHRRLNLHWDTILQQERRQDRLERQLQGVDPNR